MAIGHLVKSSCFCKYLQVKVPWELCICRSINGAGGWELVSLGGMISHVNFIYFFVCYLFVTSSESEQISRVLCSGLECAANGLSSKGLSPPESLQLSHMSRFLSLAILCNCEDLEHLEHTLCMHPQTDQLFNYNCFEILYGALLVFI